MKEGEKEKNEEKTEEFDVQIHHFFKGDEKSTISKERGTISMTRSI